MSNPTIPLVSKLDKTKRFPLPIVDSFNQWTNPSDLKAEEEILLDFVGLKPGSPKEPYQVESIDVPVGETDHGTFYINELNVKNAEFDHNDDHVVVLHGYGASKGFFYRNLKSLADLSNSNIHAIDWPGYGLSSRFPVTMNGGSKVERVKAAELWFLTYLEEWRKQRNIKSFKLIAHSLGAYLGTVYAAQYPERVEKLMLVSPAGCQRGESSIDPQELYENLDDIDLAEHIKPIPKLPSWATWLWEHNVSPFSIVRNSLFFGPKLISGWTSRRFTHLSTEEQIILQRYIYSLVKKPGSGEFFLNHLLAPGAVARWPLVERLRPVKCDTLFLYGENDWMDINGGYDAVERLKSYGRVADCVQVKGAGHHVYLDNEHEFNSIVHKFFGVCGECADTSIDNLS